MDKRLTALGRPTILAATLLLLLALLAGRPVVAQSGLCVPDCSLAEIILDDIVIESDPLRFDQFAAAVVAGGPFDVSDIRVARRAVSSANEGALEFRFASDVQVSLQIGYRVSSSSGNAAIEGAFLSVFGIQNRVGVPTALMAVETLTEVEGRGILTAEEIIPEIDFDRRIDRATFAPESSLLVETNLQVDLGIGGDRDSARIVPRPLRPLAGLPRGGYGR